MIKKEPSIYRQILEWSATILGAILIALIFRSYCFATTEVRQSSMEGTLMEGQRVLEYKLGYLFSSPKAGDIIIFRVSKNKENFFTKLLVEGKDLITGFFSSKDKNHLIKRVIGVPGDTVDIKDGAVWVNGVKLDEPYAKGITNPNEQTFPLKVPPHSVFVLGDNREVSMDSRNFGTVDYSRIEGKAILRIWPLNKFGKIKS